MCTSYRSHRTALEIVVGTITRFTLCKQGGIKVSGREEPENEVAGEMQGLSAWIRGTDVSRTDDRHGRENFCC